MGKHLKKLRSEKAKVQLKKKKLLPKGQNVTDASFKVKKISIVEQLKVHGDYVPITSGNKSLKDLLNQLHHHNVAAQLSSLKGIKELFYSNPTLSCGLTLRKVVSGVLELSVGDFDKKVRRESIRLLSSVLTPLSAETLSSFNDLLNRQLQRGLSHINSGIQNDSLKLLDLIMTVAPPGEFHELQLLLGLLLRMLTLTGSSAAPRISVMQRILSLCATVLKAETQKPVSHQQVSWKERIAPLPSVYKSYPQLNLDGKKNEVQDEAKQTLLNKLMSALLGVWSECSPSEFIAEESLNLLGMISNTIVVICRYLDREAADPDNTSMRNWFRSSFKEPIRRTLLCHFPYQLLGTTQKTFSRKPDFQDDTDALSPLIGLNLSLGHLYYWFKVQKPALEKKTDTFIMDTLRTTAVSNEMLTLLETILAIKSKQEATLAAIASSCSRSGDSKLQRFLCRVILEPHMSQYLSNATIVRWINDLANDLSTKSSECLNVVCVLASREDLVGLRDTMRQTLRPLLARAGDAVLDDRCKTILHIAYWTIPHDELLDVVKGITSPSIRRYVKNIMNVTEC